MSRRLSISLIALLGAASCGPRGGTDVGNGATVSFSLAEFMPGSVSSALSKPANTTLTLPSGDAVEEVWVAVEKISLQACEHPDDDGKSTFDGPIIVNLLADDPPMGDAVTIAPGRYCKLGLALHEIQADELPPGAPSDLAEVSLLMRGHRADGVAFVVRSREPISLKLNATKAGGFTLFGDNPLIIAFDLGAMEASLDLGSVDASPVLVDADHEAKRLKALEKVTKKTAALFRDTNGDGVLSADEVGDEGALAEGE